MLVDVPVYLWQLIWYKDLGKEDGKIDEGKKCVEQIGLLFILQQEKKYKTWF